MLKTLTVSNFALVDQLEIHFGPGLTVITGESGAGKSILLGALSLVLGERAAADTIRPGCSRADVSAELDLTGIDEALAVLAEQSLDDPDQPGRILVRRVVNADGRSRAYLNGTPVTLNVLKRLTEGLIDIYGQDDNQRLADPGVQRSLLDAWGVDHERLESCRAAYHAWKAAAGEHSRRVTQVRSLEDRATLLSYQLEELGEAAPAPGEFEEIERLHRRLSRASQMRDVVAEVMTELEQESILGGARASLMRLEDDHPALQSARDSLLTISDLIADVLHDLRDFEESLSLDPQALADQEARLTLLHELARKHRVSPETLPELIASLDAELTAISTDRGSLNALAEEAARQEKAYRAHAAELSSQRQAAADGFCQAVSGYMNTLGIKGGALSLTFLPRESEFGAETVEFSCVTNPRYPAAPLTRIASGGERARISLAIQIVAAERMQLPSLVLDEADVGVGGITADVVGRLLRGLAGHTQVICITHAPQIAALGATHLLVEKNSEQDTLIAELDGPQRIDELARMLSGAKITEESRDYARSLLGQAAV